MLVERPRHAPCNPLPTREPQREKEPDTERRTCRDLAGILSASIARVIAEHLVVSANPPRLALLPSISPHGLHDQSPLFARSRRPFSIMRTKK